MVNIEMIKMYVLRLAQNTGQTPKQRGRGKTQFKKFINNDVYKNADCAAKGGYPAETGIKKERKSSPKRQQEKHEAHRQQLEKREKHKRQYNPTKTLSQISELANRLFQH